MTIHKYYFTFGYLVDMDECIALLGFTPDKLTDEIRQEIVEEGRCSAEDEDIHTPQQWVRGWFEMEARESWNLKWSFELDNVKYVVRSFCHDHKLSDKCYIVGVDIGKLGRYDGVYTPYLVGTNETPKQLLATLAQNSDWRSAIQKIDQDTWIQSKSKPELHLIPQPDSDSRYCISPALYTTTNDCDCCS